VIAEISASAFDSFFAWAPWVIGIVIYFAFYVAKRHETVTVPSSSVPTYACAVCGRRGSRDQMVAQDHGGAVGWRCHECTAAAAGNY
jgi:hypothetical protein